MSVRIDANIDGNSRFSEDKMENPFARCKLDGCGREEPIAGEQEINRHLPIPVSKIELLHEMRIILLPVPPPIVSESFRIRSLEGLHKPSIRQKGEGISMFDAASNGFPRNHRPCPSLAGGSESLLHLLEQLLTGALFAGEPRGAHLNEKHDCRADRDASPHRNLLPHVFPVWRRAISLSPPGQALAATEALWLLRLWASEKGRSINKKSAAAGTSVRANIAGSKAQKNEDPKLSPGFTFERARKVALSAKP